MGTLDMSYVFRDMNKHLVQKGLQLEPNQKPIMDGYYGWMDLGKSPCATILPSYTPPYYEPIMVVFPSICHYEQKANIILIEHSGAQAVQA